MGRLHGVVDNSSVASVLEKLFTPKKRPCTNQVAGVLSPDGGIRTIIERPADMHCHLTPGEQLFPVDLWFLGDAEWNDFPRIVRAAQRQIYRMTNGQHGSLEIR